MTIGAVIVTYNNEKTVQACIVSLLIAGVKQIVAVDSNSQDDSAAVLEKQSVETVQLTENKGFGYAANRGAELLNTDYVLFINPDARLENEALSSMASVIEKNEKAGVVGGMLVDERGVPEKYGYGNTVTPFEILTRRFKKSAADLFPVSVGWVSGGAILVRLDVFRAIAGFDDRFFLYWEDVDLCRRVKSAGYKVYIDPKARVTHARGASSLDARKKTELYDASANRYFQKYYPPIIWRSYILFRKIYRLAHPLAQ